MKVVTPALKPTEIQFGLIPKILTYLCFLAVWFIIGVVLPLWLFIGNVRTSGQVANQLGMLLWAAMPITALVAVIKPTLATAMALVANLCVWLGFLVVYYITFARASSN